MDGERRGDGDAGIRFQPATGIEDAGERIGDVAQHAGGQGKCPLREEVRRNEGRMPVGVRSDTQMTEVVADEGGAGRHHAVRELRARQRGRREDRLSLSTTPQAAPRCVEHRGDHPPLSRQVSRPE